MVIALGDEQRLRHYCRGSWEDSWRTAYKLVPAEEKDSELSWVEHRGVPHTSEDRGHSHDTVIGEDGGSK